MDSQNNVAKNIILSFLAGAAVASASVYLSRKENRDDLSRKLDDFKNILFERTQTVGEKVKDASQQIHDSAVESVDNASQTILEKADTFKNVVKNKKDDFKNAAGGLKQRVDEKIDIKTTSEL